MFAKLGSRQERQDGPGCRNKAQITYETVYYSASRAAEVPRQPEEVYLTAVTHALKLLLCGQARKEVAIAAAQREITARTWWTI